MIRFSVHDRRSVLLLEFSLSAAALGFGLLHFGLRCLDLLNDCDPRAAEHLGISQS